MFKLTLQRRDGSLLMLRYDPHKSLLTYGDGTRVDTAPVGMALGSSVPHRIERVSQASPTPKSNRLARLKIQLGLGCNYACSYCSQAADRAADRPRERRSDVGAFLARLPEWLHADADSRLRVEFWGGEPFAYWKTLKRLAEGIRARYPHADFSLTTNGSLLDDGKVAWLLELGFFVGVSHDGPGQPLRGPDPFDDPKRAAGLRRLHDTLAPLGRMSFHCVLTLPQHSFVAVREHIAARLGVDPAHVPLSTEGLLVPHDAAAIGLSPSTEDERRMVRDRLFTELARPDILVTAAGASRLESFFRSLSAGVDMGGAYQRCGMDRPDQIAVNLDGDALVCQNASASSHVIGSVYDFDNIRLTRSTHWSHRPECNACPMLGLCGGSCMFLTGKQRRAACDNEFTFAMAYFRLALYMLTDALLVRIERPEGIRFPEVAGVEEYVPAPPLAERRHES